VNQSDIISATLSWVDTVVIGLNFCPFAKRELVKGSVRFTVCEATNEEELLQHLQQELRRLDNEPDLATTLLIHPYALGDFMRYNEFLEQANDLWWFWHGVLPGCQLSPALSVCGYRAGRRRELHQSFRPTRCSICCAKPAWKWPLITIRT